MALLARLNTPGADIRNFYTVPAGVQAYVEVTICNRNGSAATVTLGQGAPSLSYDITTMAVLYRQTVAAGATFVRTGLMLGPGEILWTDVDISLVTIIASGVEEVI